MPGVTELIDRDRDLVKRMWAWVDLTTDRALIRRATFAICSPTASVSLAKMLAGANAFKISDIERMTTRAHQPGV